MHKDYARSYVAAIGKNRNKRRNKKTVSAPKNFLPAVKLMWHAISAMLLRTLAIGITSTIWYGWQVRSALDEMGQTKTINGNLTNENKLLAVKRELMLSQEYMVDAAKKQGLGVPSKDQLRYP